MVLYHAVSSYQLLEVMLHRMLFEKQEQAILLLPDFIVEKYPQYRKLEKNFFTKVYLFPYSRILHREENKIRRDVKMYYAQTVPYPLHSFSRIYIAGAHFYFTVYVIECGIPFIFFEDAAGILSRAGELYRGLQRTYPVHAEIALEYGLFDGTNTLIQEIICLKSAQTKDFAGERYKDFSVEHALAEISEKQRKKVIRFFIKRKIGTRADGILLTQQFSNLGLMSAQKQRELYRKLYERELRGKLLLIKRHPDDHMDYRDIFPGAKYIRGVFPAELLPYVFRKKPEIIYTVDSTGCENLKEHFVILRTGREKIG